MLTRRAFLMLGSCLVALPLPEACTKSEPSVPLDSSISGADLHSVLYRRDVPAEREVQTITLIRNRNGRAVAKRMIDVRNGEFVQRETHELGDWAFDKMAQIAAAYNLRGASEQPEGTEQEPDASVESITYTYLDADGEADEESAFTVRTTQELTDFQREGFDVAFDALWEMLDEG